MELIIKEAEKQNKTTNAYQITIVFMVGDADGYNRHTIKFDEKLLDNLEFKEELELFCGSIIDCINQDSKGRGGFDDSEDLIEEYIGIKNWMRYCTSALENFDFEDIEDVDGIAKKEFEYKKSEIYRNMLMYDVSRSDCGFYDSYEELIIQYYDSNGDIFPVEIKF